MSDELRLPPVIDLDTLLQPISEENPSGENLRYSGIYDEIAEARRADQVADQGEWKTELKVADYNKVINLAVPALTTQSKDLQVTVWAAEAFSKLHEFAGLRDSMQLIAALQEKFWDTLHPEIDEGDMEGRANAIAWLDMEDQFPLIVKSMKITGGLGYSFIDWEDSQRFNYPEDPEAVPFDDREKVAALRAQAEKEKRVTSTLWQKEKAATRRASMEVINFAIAECWTALADLNRVIEEKFDRNQMPGLSNFAKALGDVHTQVKLLLEEKRLEEPDPIDEEETVEGEAAGEGGGGARGEGSVSGAISNRKDALRRLAEIAAFFQKTEPHSPVSYLVQRAVKWGNMGLESWLQEVIKDQSVLFQLRETLGVDGSSSGGGGGGGEGMMEEGGPRIIR